MTDTRTQEPQTPPYASFTAVTSFLEKLKKTTVPPSIDKSMMPKMSGSAQIQLIHALRFLRLIGEDGATLPTLRELVESHGSSAWPGKLGEVISAAFGDIVRNLDVRTGTSKQLRDAFRATKVSEGEVLAKCVRFYLNALEATGITVSPHFAERQPRSGGQQKRSSGNPVANAFSDADGEGQNEFVDPPPGKRTRDSDAPKDREAPGMRRWPLHIPGKPTGLIIVPDNLTEDDCEMLDAAIAPIKLFARRRSAMTNSEEAT